MKFIGQLILITTLVLIILGVFYLLNSFTRPRTRFEDLSFYEQKTFRRYSTVARVS